jgi:mannose-6-phosphate isomerase-like protein (cupin superfamily)
MVLEPGASEGGGENHHKGADQWLYVVSGKGVAIVNGKKAALLPKTLLLIERGENHEIRNTGSTQLCTVNIYLPKAYKKNGDTMPPGRK